MNELVEMREGEVPSKGKDTRCVCAFFLRREKWQKFERDPE